MPSEGPVSGLCGEKAHRSGIRHDAAWRHESPPRRRCLGRTAVEGGELSAGGTSGVMALIDGGSKMARRRTVLRWVAASACLMMAAISGPPARAQGQFTVANCKSDQLHYDTHAFD